MANLHEHVFLPNSWGYTGEMMDKIHGDVM